MKTKSHTGLKLSLKILAFFSTILLYSCKKFVDIGSPVDKLNTNEVFSDSTNATAAILGIYIDMSSEFTSPKLLNGGLSIVAGLSADELDPVNGLVDQTDFYLNSVSTRTNNINDGYFWKYGYNIIYETNACIEGLSASTRISNSLKNQLTGEAKFIRALCYFYLINLYGDVPLVTTTDYKINASLPRTSVALVYRQILIDLLEAKEQVKESYVSVGRLRPNKSTVLSLLARVYLYEGKWAEAEMIANQVIANTGLYNIVTDLSKVFEPNSREAIWQMKVDPSSQGLGSTTEAWAFIPSSASEIPSYTLSSSFLNAFETSDVRKNIWIAKNTVLISGQLSDFYYPFKYRVKSFQGSTSESSTLFRLSELFLIRSEARAQQNKIQDSENDLNVIRNRAGLQNTLANTQADLLNAIYHERQIEFFCEWGHRWLDLKRTGRIDAVMQSVASTKQTTWSSDWALYPIPYTQIQLNPFLVQNPGYN